jgi:hypothetical protein
VSTLVQGGVDSPVSALFEDLLAKEVARLDPHGGRFGVDVGKIAGKLQCPTARINATASARKSQPNTVFSSTSATQKRQLPT